MKLKALTAAVLAAVRLRFLRSVLCCTGSGYFQRNCRQRR